MPKIMVKEPGRKARIINFDGKYRDEVRKFIGKDATLESVGIKRESESCLEMMVDEDGKIIGLEPNFFLPLRGWGVDTIVGPVVFLRRNNPSFEEEIWDFELEDLTEKDIALLQYVLSTEGQGKILLGMTPLFEA